MEILRILGLKPLTDVKSVLCVQPHPDDNEVGAGGTLTRLAANGCQVCYVTVTDGRYGGSDQTVSADERVRIRQAELRSAGEIVGVSHHYELSFEDLGSYSEYEVMSALIPILRDVEPELVMTVDPWAPYEAHPDHQKVGRAVAAAVLAANSLIKPDCGQPCTVPMIAFYASAYPNTYVDVTDFWDAKLASILAHKSQFANDEWPLLVQYFEHQAKQYYGAMQMAQGVAEPLSEGFAEAFKVLSPRQLHFFPAALHM
ncbi:LmbE family N-acetylglucosaminyl deacetylase [Alicyclobacillus sacchari]|uniref:LmbE family N-acetylglucosaminyl deacetylase n=1 Tax=Alicyclobacillus sacchari TaxID=392010 RepID=A0A4R8LV58_9BACL|nr:PIG-L deacetylase family protein [Alicyclobacillus sacchari]TDY51022.1 LmbE family N-acetylglucosaminyl deacetylase [Alicyclobacillus sacchari]GMA56228.1 diacetylchitobiose deacetylase [Alicyclobacillus sacchari]